jgi:hypothetical protein
MKFEEILPHIRKGRKVRRARWRSPYCISMLESGLIIDCDGDSRVITGKEMNADDWELVPEPVKTAAYLVRQSMRLYNDKGQEVIDNIWFRETHPIGQQPEGSVLVPGSEREEQV